MGPNSGGGRRNQAAAALDGPRRALFSSKGQDRKGGKGEKGKGKKEPRPVFESQKERDKAKGKGKVGTLSPAEAHIAAAAARAPGASSGEQAAKPSIWQRPGKAPSYIHGVFCMTRDDHFALEPLLTPSFDEATSLVHSASGEPMQLQEQMPRQIAEDARKHLQELNVPAARAKSALEIVGPRLLREAEDQETCVTDCLAAERALEFICSTSAEDSLPSKLREPREVTAARKQQEDRNVTFQTKALLLGGEFDSNSITRIEKLGFSRARAIQALAEATGHELLPAAKALLSEYLPLDLPDGVCPRSIKTATPAELQEEVEALQSIYGEQAVHNFSHAGTHGLELTVSLPANGQNGGGGRWMLAALIPSGLLYPHVAPLLCPRHERLRDASRPRLMLAIGNVCREVCGAPMLFIVCEWLQENGHRFLVRTAPALAEDCDDAVHADAQPEQPAGLQRSKPVEESVGPKLKDKFAAEIRGRPETSQFDLCGYEEPQVRQLVKEAFGTPLECKAMIRITFVVGGGKATRGKYNESLSRYLGEALQELGFAQDSTASCDLASAGSFKGQHDKERNQKLVHIFPNLIGNTSSGAGATRSTAESTEEACKRLACCTWDEFVDELGPRLRARDS